MASKLWYPPIVNDSEPAFIEKARIYFSFNKLCLAQKFCRYTFNFSFLHFYSPIPLWEHCQIFLYRQEIGKETVSTFLLGYAHRWNRTTILQPCLLRLFQMESAGIKPRRLLRSVVFPIPLDPVSTIFSPRSICIFSGEESGSS